ncbi:hypothetical protein SLE2022_183040 [Rubroshorea leprosula]
MEPLLQSSQPWVEKFRPKHVKDVAHQEEVVRVLTNTLETANEIPFFLQSPNINTRCTVSLFFYLPELYKSRVLELNASDDRGINVVRTKIKNLASVAVGMGHPCRPFKIIILDEADSMTEDAQNALRRTMETYSRVTRFFFICNYISRIIEPLASSCKGEGLNIDSEALPTLSSISQGDLQRAITYSQGAARVFGSSISSKDLISVLFLWRLFRKFTRHAKVGTLIWQRRKLIKLLQKDIQFLRCFLSYLIWLLRQMISQTNRKLARICKNLGEADKCLVEGADEYLQLLDMTSNTMRALCNMPQEFCFES